jgi:glutamine synthetase
MVFDDKAMRARLSAEVYESLRETIRKGKKLDLSVANAVADAMGAWAAEKGATHFTHWFQPLTGITAEKHEGFLAPAPDSHVLMKFSGNALIQGEPDASSFPSGGLRATFEARGYTAWDPTSYAFIKEKTLCIPTAFCSYGGEALDKKTPLLRSMEALNTQALRILRLFGNKDVQRVVTNVGPEQEYFLVDRDMYLKRKDLIYTGRTLFGARPPKGQELEDHYFGAIKPRVKAFMEELDEELWKLGVMAKTEHNEVAPGQHELAPIFTVANVASDHNQLTMEIMKKVARRHGMVCLLHEKPFAGVNGSGKHNNWSMSTDTGVNLLSPGETPYANAQFLLFLVAVLKAVDEYQGLLRLSVASAGNDHRLGANEAPPAVISVFLGDELSAVLEAIETESPYAGTEKRRLRLGTDVLPRFNRDTTDRNRTSPFAFTGNKFEFRMVGSSDSISCANIMINAAVAEALRQFADRLESAETDFDTALHELIREAICKHKRIIFNGNGYDEAWIREATEKRGLLNLCTTPDALQMVLVPENVDMLVRHGIFSEAEIRSRYEITLENYVRTVRIEALTMVDMVRREILPALMRYRGDIAASLGAAKQVAPALPCMAESKLVTQLSSLIDGIDEAVEALGACLAALDGDVTAEAFYIKDRVIERMTALRKLCDEAETITAAAYWPFPTYGELLFGV